MRILTNSDLRIITITCSCRNTENPYRHRPFEKFTCGKSCLFAFSIRDEKRWKEIFDSRHIFYYETLALWAHILEKEIESGTRITPEIMFESSFKANIHKIRGLVYDSLLADLRIIWEHRSEIIRCCRQKAYATYWSKSTHN